MVHEVQRRDLEELGGSWVLIKRLNSARKSAPRIGWSTWRGGIGTENSRYQTTEELIWNPKP